MSRRRRFPGFSPRTLFAACVIGACPGTPLDAQQDPLIEAVVRVQIIDGPSEVVQALTYNSTLLLPFRRFMAMSEIPLAAYAPDDSATFVLEPSGLRVQFGPDRDQLIRGDTVVALDSLHAVWWDGELWVATETLNRALGVAIRMEWADLSAIVGGSAGLPVVRRARRARRYAILDQYRRPGRTEYEYTPRETLADGAVFTYSLRTAPAGRASNTSLDLGFGAKIWGGSAELRHFWQSAAGPNVSEFRASWKRAWPENRWLRQVRVGDVLTNGRRAQFVTGAVVTNAPFIRSSQFDIEPIIGRLPVGWEVELYDRGRLRGFADVGPSGAFELPLQLRYGINPFDLVLYGPGGEVIREERTVRVPFSRLPEGQFEYAAALGACRFAACSGVLSTDARYGITSQVTVQAGADVYWRANANDVWQPYALVSAAPIPAMRVTAEAVVNGHLRAAFGYEPSPNLRADIAHTAFDETGNSLFGRAFEKRRTEVSLFWRPVRWRQSVFFQAAGVHSSGTSNSRSFQRVAATYRPNWVQYTVGVKRDVIGLPNLRSIDRSGFDVTAQAVFPWRTELLRGLTVRALAGVELDHGLASLQGSVGRQIERLFRVDLGLGWDRLGGYRLDLALTSILPGPRIGTRSSVTSSGSSALLFVDGSVIADPSTRSIHLSDGRDLGRAGIAGFIFLDENANGIADPGERGIEGIPVRAGGWLARTDAEGRFAAWDLFPWEVSFVEVDTLAFEDPRLVVVTPVIRVRPTPNSYLALDIPVVMGAEVSGFVTLDGEGLPGVPVILRNLATGATIAMTTFSDGGFYKLGVPPGDYELNVPDAYLEQFRAMVTSLIVSIPTGMDAASVQLDDLLLQLERLPQQ